MLSVGQFDAHKSFRTTWATNEFIMVELSWNMTSEFHFLKFMMIYCKVYLWFYPIICICAPLQSYCSPD